MYILSQVLVILSDVFCVISMLCKKKIQVVFNLILSTILFSAHYMCLSAWTAAVIGLVEIAFLVAMYLLEIKDKTKYNNLLTIITIVVTITLSIITWDSWLSLIPMLSMVLYLIAMMFVNLIIVKSGVFIRLGLNAVYMFILKSYFGSVLSIVLLVFTIIGIVRDYRYKKIKK